MVLFWPVYEEKTGITENWIQETLICWLLNFQGKSFSPLRCGTSEGFMEPFTAFSPCSLTGNKLRHRSFAGIFLRSNSFHANAPFSYPLKTSENLLLPIRNGKLVWKESKKRKFSLHHGETTTLLFLFSYSWVYHCYI